MHTIAQALLMDSALSADPYFSSVSSLISLDEGTGLTAPVDVISGVVWTNGLSRQNMLTSFSKFGAGCSYRDGTVSAGGYLSSITYTGSAPRIFTAEFWVYFIGYYTPIPDQNRFWDISGGGGGHGLYIDYTTGQVGYLNGSFSGTLTGVVPGLNTWRHFAFQADGSDLRLFMDGVQIYTVASSSVLPQTGDVSQYSPGRCSRGNADYYTGYIDEARLTCGVARYTAAGFAVPTAPYPRF